MAINDSGHRPHGTHFHQEPHFNITHGPESLSVTLDTWGPQHNVFPALYDMLQANWGDAPSRTTEHHLHGSMTRLDHLTGWNKLTPGQRDYVRKAFAGGTLSQALEMLTFTFTIDGVTRAFTHEFVRARIGAGFMQHGGRDNDWRHRDWTMPETIWRACQRPEEMEAAGLVNAIIDWKPIHRYLDGKKGEAIVGRPSGSTPTSGSLMHDIEDYLQRGRDLYAALVDAGIPWQDARRLIPIGTQTYIHGAFNYIALRGLLANRLEHIMDWEINCISQLMLRELRMKCPPVFWQHLGSHSDMAKRPVFAGLDSWPPDGKYPYHPACVCGHARANHLPQDLLVRGGQEYCEVCLREHTKCPGYTPVEEPRMHRVAQNPFWVLTKSAMEGEPVAWIKTNGVFPHEEYAKS